jgi:hypothetical protein
MDQSRRICRSSSRTTFKFAADAACPCLLQHGLMAARGTNATKQDSANRSADQFKADVIQAGYGAPASKSDRRPTCRRIAARGRWIFRSTKASDVCEVLARERAPAAQRDRSVAFNFVPGRVGLLRRSRPERKLSPTCSPRGCAPVAICRRVSRLCRALCPRTDAALVRRETIVQRHPDRGAT